MRSVSGTSAKTPISSSAREKPSWGCAQAHKLFALVEDGIRRKDGVETRDRSTTMSCHLWKRFARPVRRAWRRTGWLTWLDHVYRRRPAAPSGLQHLVFCERQWGLIHIEQSLGGEPADGGGARAARAGARGWRGVAAGAAHGARTAAALFAAGALRAGGRRRVSPRRRRAVALDGGRRAGGGRSLWSTSGGGRSRTVVTKSSYARRRCAWRRCSGIRWRRGRCSTERRGGGGRCRSTRDCAGRPSGWRRACTSCIARARRRGRSYAPKCDNCSLIALCMPRALAQAAGRGAVSGAGAGGGRRMRLSDY